MTFRYVKDKLGGRTFCVLHCQRCGRELHAQTHYVATSLMCRKPMRCPCGGHIKELEEIVNDLRSNSIGDRVDRGIHHHEED